MMRRSVPFFLLLSCRSLDAAARLVLNNHAKRITNKTDTNGSTYPRKDQRDGRLTVTTPPSSSSLFASSAVVVSTVVGDSDGEAAAVLEGGEYNNTSSSSSPCRLQTPPSSSSTPPSVFLSMEDDSMCEEPDGFTTELPGEGGGSREGRVTETMPAAGEVQSQSAVADALKESLRPLPRTPVPALAAVHPHLRRRLAAPPALLATSLVGVDVLVEDVFGGTIRPMRITNRHFEWFEIKQLVLELPLPASPAPAVPAPVAATTTSPTSPQPAPPPQPHRDYFIVPDFASLLQLVHTPPLPGGGGGTGQRHRSDGGGGRRGNDTGGGHTRNGLVFRMLPRRARSNNAYAAVREICGMPGAPFDIAAHSVDPHLYRCGLKSELMDVVKQWNESTDARLTNFTLPTLGATTVAFDGMLVAEQDAALVQLVPALNEKAVSQITGSVAFLRFFAPQSARRITFEFEMLWADVLRRRRVHMFLVSERAPTRDALGFARMKGVHMLSRYGHHYKLCT